MCWCNIAGSGKHEGKGMFGRGYGIASWGIHDNDPMSACCFPIDVINPYSSSPDCAERCDHLRRPVRLVAVGKDQRVDGQPPTPLWKPLGGAEI